MTAPAIAAPSAAIAAPSAVLTYPPTKRIIGREIHGARAAVKLECGHVVVAAITAIAARCSACRPVEVLRG